MSAYRKAANRVPDQVYAPSRLKRAIAFLGTKEVTFVMFLICASSMAAMDGTSDGSRDGACTRTVHTTTATWCSIVLGWEGLSASDLIVVQNDAFSW